MAFAPQPAPATPYPEGPSGIARSVQEVAQAMRDGRLDPDLRAWAIDVLTAAGLDGRNRPPIRAQANALLNALRAATIYVPDPEGAEWIQKPHVTLCLRDRCIRGGDCDDLTAALGGAMLSVGLPAYAVKADYGPGHQQHILNGVLDEQGRPLYVDLSTNESVQTSIPHVINEDWINPLDMTSKVTGTMGAEMVTLGKPMMKRELYYKAGHWFEFRYGQWWMHAGGKWLAGPSEAASKGLPGMGRPFKKAGSFWASVGEVDVELRPGQAGLGTIFGYHTIHELQDLLAALTSQVTQITNAYTASSSQWQAANQAEWQAWTDSYNAAMAGWTTEATAAQAMITAASSGVNAPSDYVLAITTGGDDEFDKLAKAFEPFEALDRQLRQSTAFPAANLPTYASTPQPTAPDLDLAAYQIADSAWQKVKQVGSEVQFRLEQAAPYIAIAGAAVAIYAVYRVGEILPRGRRA
jgi:hypothetical protein